MVLAYLLICQLLKITYGTNSPEDEDLYVLVSKESAEADLVFMTKLTSDLNSCIGDNKEMIIEDFDPNTLLSIKNLIDPVSGSWFYENMHTLSGEITRTARLAIQWPVGGRRDYENDTSLDALLERMKEGYSEINRRLYDLRSIETSVPFWTGPQFDMYVKKREKLTYVADKWSAWSSVPSNNVSYEQFVSSCHSFMGSKWGLEDWLLGVEAATKEQLSSGSALLYNRRKAVIQVGRLIKLDFCTAMILLGACDVVRRQDDGWKKTKKLVEKYQDFAEASLKVDTILVTNAREDVTKDTKAILSRQMDIEYPEGYECDFLSSVAENITNSLKDRFFWLEFAVIVIDGRRSCCDGGTCRNHYHITEFSPEKECPCMISTGPMSPPSKPFRRYQAIVNVAERTWESPESDWFTAREWGDHRRNSYLRYKTLVQQVAQSERCTLKQNSICDAHDFFVGTTTVHNGVPTASYFATVFYDNEYDGAIRVAESTYKRHRIIRLYHDVPLYDSRICGNRSVSVISTSSCDTDLYTY